VEAAGVELISVLRTRKLLILETATTAKKRPHCPIHCTFIVRKCFRSGVQQTPPGGHSIAQIVRYGSKRTLAECYPLSRSRLILFQPRPQASAIR
jgi:hypothetical protein